MLATFIVFQSNIVSNTVLANSTKNRAIALKIEDLKQSDRRWIEIDLSDQHLFAWSGKNQTFTAVVSTGKAKTPTHPGIYTIQRKYPVDRMRGADYDRGYALHGANWHNNFGTTMTHGCVNLPVANAEWLFDWAALGTTVIIHQ